MINENEIWSKAYAYSNGDPADVAYWYGVFIGQAEQEEHRRHNPPSIPQQKPLPRSREDSLAAVITIVLGVFFLIYLVFHI